MPSNFHRDVEAFLAKHGLGHATFGRLALGDTGFVTRLRAGRSPRLVTADRVLAFMREYRAPPDLLPAVEAFMERWRITAPMFGRMAVKDSKLVMDLREGRNMRPETAERVRAFMKDYARRQRVGASSQASSLS